MSPTFFCALLQSAEGYIRWEILSRHRHRLIVHRLQRRRSPHIWCTPSLLGLSYPKIIKQIIVLADMIISGNIYFYFPCLYKSSQMIFFLFVIHIVKPVGKPFFLRNGFSVCPFYLINKKLRIIILRQCIFRNDNHVVNVP